MQTWSGVTRFSGVYWRSFEMRSTASGAAFDRNTCVPTPTQSLLCARTPAPTPSLSPPRLCLSLAPRPAPPCPAPCCFGISQQNAAEGAEQRGGVREGGVCHLGPGVCLDLGELELGIVLVHRLLAPRPVSTPPSRAVSTLALALQPILPPALRSAPRASPSSVGRLWNDEGCGGTPNL